MTKSWKQTANPDVLQHMSILTKQIEDLTNKLDNNKSNYNKCQSRLAKALSEIERLECTLVREKQLLHAITVANRETKKAIKQRDSARNAVRDLKGNYQ